MRLLGKVVDNFDPEYEGKIKCRIFSKQEEKDKSGNYIINDDSLPWCVRLIGNDKSSFSIPDVGDVVILYKVNEYTYLYESMLKVDKDVKADLLENKNYLDANVLLYRKLKSGTTVGIYYTDETGLVIESSCKDGKKIVLSNDGDISIEIGKSFIKMDKSSIEINSKKLLINSDNVVINGGSERLITANEVMNIFNKHTHGTTQGPTGVPFMPIGPNSMKKKIKV